MLFYCLNRNILKEMINIFSFADFPKSENKLFKYYKIYYNIWDNV
jgi:hypothetical protein